MMKRLKKKYWKKKTDKENVEKIVQVWKNMKKYENEKCEWRIIEKCEEKIERMVQEFTSYGKKNLHW